MTPVQASTRTVRPARWDAPGYLTARTAIGDEGRDMSIALTIGSEQLIILPLAKEARQLPELVEIQGKLCYAGFGNRLEDVKPEVAATGPGYIQQARDFPVIYVHQGRRYAAFNAQSFAFFNSLFHKIQELPPLKSFCVFLSANSSEHPHR